jgi:hypothetical protein
MHNASRMVEAHTTQQRPLLFELAICFVTYHAHHKGLLFGFRYCFRYFFFQSGFSEAYISKVARMWTASLCLLISGRGTMGMSFRKSFSTCSRWRYNTRQCSLEDSLQRPMHTQLKQNEQRAMVHER